ncbi:protein FAM13A-like isoform X4 [Brachyhypopomus gauderio]
MHSNTTHTHSNTSDIHSNTPHTHSNTTHIHSNIPNMHSNTTHTHSNNSDIHSDTSHTHTPRCQSHGQSATTHPRSSHTRRESTHPPSEARKAPVQKHNTKCDTTHSHSDTHTRSHTPTVSFCSDTGSPTAVRCDTHTERCCARLGPAPPDRGLTDRLHADQPDPSRRVPVWKVTSTLGSEQDPASSVPSSQSHSTKFLSKVSLQRRHVHNLKPAVKSFEKPFQLSPSDKATLSASGSQRNEANLITVLRKDRRPLRGLRSRQCTNGVKRSCSSTTAQQEETKLIVTKPAMEDTLNMVAQRLKEKRLELNIPPNIQDMSRVQLVLEKNTLQKCLLYYESLHGRPKSREERSVMRDLYDRYRLVKQVLYISNTETNTTLDKHITSTNDAHTIHRAELLRQMKNVQEEKRRLRKILKQYKETRVLNTGRNPQREDWVTMAMEYERYKALKARLRQLTYMRGEDSSPQRPTPSAT